MRSPFPGMDPYLEARWDDVHTSLCAYIREAVQPGLPNDLRARAEERVLLEDEQGDLVSYRPDAAIVETPFATHRPPTTPGGVATIEPIMVEYLEEPYVDRWVQIIDSRNGNRVVTVIEILSPGNKTPGRLNDLYRKKIDGYLRADVNIVELDLLRTARHLMTPTAEISPQQRMDYRVNVRRVTVPGKWAVYPLSLRDPLPRMPIPLRPRDPDVMLDMQALIDRIYVAGGHDDIDYAKPCEPPLAKVDAEWMAGLVQARGADAS